MQYTRIGLALGAFTAVMVGVTGTPTAFADVTSVVVRTSSGGTGINDWVAQAQVLPCDGVTTVSVAFTDNGKPMPGSPVAQTPHDCGAYSGWVGIPFRPTTLGAHHIVAQQLNADGSVASSGSQDVDVTSLPCQQVVSSGSSGSKCQSSTGSW
ncbi:hypothetical protein [Nocardia concava]|uniref:hypothetical protein n=1 Tax=Nocardia concava TaxID=257281 RepID=UPI0012F83F70|nr:hypothetical protein [Nocardia concava]